MTLSLGLINLPECLTEFRRPVYSAGDQFITKDERIGTNGLVKRDTGRGLEETSVPEEFGAQQGGRRKRSGSPTQKLSRPCSFVTWYD